MSSPGILTEVLIQVLSAVVQQCNSKLRLSVGLTADEKRAELRATAYELAFSESDPLLHRALQTARSLGFEGKVTKGDLPNTHTIVLSVNAVQPRPILVIEDNTGAV